MRYCLTVILLFGIAAPAFAFKLAWPVACTLQQDCWLVNYFDHNPAGSPFKDYACGWYGYKGHDGTDIAVRDLVAVRAGVAVLAAAAGTVVGVRDGEPDAFITPKNEATREGKECGNGVRLDHGGGYVTQYCHLRQGSIRVRSGQVVQVGEALGYIGLSGMTEFPHLHLSVFKDGLRIDPFNGRNFRDNPTQIACGDATGSLWEKTPPYPAIQIAALGIAPEKPTREKAENGEYQSQTLANTASALVGWFKVYSASTGDTISLTLSDANGKTLTKQAFTMPRHQIRYFGFAGVPRPAAGKWPSGTYTLLIEAGDDAEIKDKKLLTFTVSESAVPRFAPPH